MLIVALRNVRRAARMAHSHMRVPQAKEQLAEALVDFDLALPGITDARNVVEHFDEYSIGIGQLQRAQLRDEPSLTPGELADTFAVRFGWTDSDERRPQLRVGQHVIEIGRAGDAASLLVDEIWAALKTEEGTPTSRSAAWAIHQAQKNERLRRRPQLPRRGDGAEYVQ
ncbi:hypothetical protein [Micromonospora sp. 4G55]|uniref:hypothetical protein n=1 Tax=Micromonospora sp. 4G55 TaxID=2806102 RepID=UPI001A46B595|nr:hypothetical protein [Micromonospora sp. 4G55]MBM0256325.1 hypothetical protein [Micromonospora sp. 4G55]MBM0258210.1 hypothetical protein [Micromonospora sp. 4G55]